MRYDQIVVGDETSLLNDERVAETTMLLQPQYNHVLFAQLKVTLEYVSLHFDVAYFEFKIFQKQTEYFLLFNGVELFGGDVS